MIELQIDEEAKKRLEGYILKRSERGEINVDRKQLNRLLWQITFGFPLLVACLITVGEYVRGLKEAQVELVELIDMALMGFVIALVLTVPSVLICRFALYKRLDNVRANATKKLQAKEKARITDDHVFVKEIADENGKEIERYDLNAIHDLRHEDGVLHFRIYGYGYRRIIKLKSEQDEPDDDRMSDDADDYGMELADYYKPSLYDEISSYLKTEEYRSAQQEEG